MHADRGMVDDAYAAVLAAIVHRFFPQAPDPGRGAALSFPERRRGSGGKEYPHRAESAPCGPHYEEVLMREETFSGGHSASFCPPTIIITQKSAIMLC